MEIEDKISYLTGELEFSVNKILTISKRDGLTQQDEFNIDELFNKVDFYVNFIVYVNNSIKEDEDFYKNHLTSINKTFQCINHFCVLIGKLD